MLFRSSVKNPSTKHAIIMDLYGDGDFEAFYNVIRRAVNNLEDKDSKKIQWVVDKIKTTPTSWNDLWSPAYKNEVSVWQDIALIYTTAIQLGYKNVYTLTDTPLEAIKTKLIAQKPNIRKYWTTAGELANLFANNEVTIGMSFGGVTVTQLQSQGRNVKEVIPVEGAAT